MSHSGVDEFYEIIRLILAKYYAEEEGLSILPDADQCNRLLATHREKITFILDDVIELQTPVAIYSEVVRILSDVSIRGQDFSALDQVFEQLTSRAYKADKGQYFTPRHVVDMCVEAIAPQPGELVCDPACGSGAFLKAAHTFGLNQHGRTAELYGFDYSHRACQVAKVVSIIGAGEQITIHQVDSLKLPRCNLLEDTEETIESIMGPGFAGFDAIVTNPPFAGDVSREAFASDYDITSSFSRRLERDVLFVERCIRLLKVGGRLAIVLPDNKISGRLFAGLRLWLGKQSSIRAVVSLHRYTFLPYTSQKAAVLFAVKQPPSLSVYNSEVSFFRSDRPGKTSNGTAVFKANADPNEPAYRALDHDLEEIAPEIRRVLCAA